MNNKIIEIPIGIIEVIWNLDEYDNRVQKAFYEIIVNINNNKCIFENNYYFLKNNTCIMKEKTSSEKFNFSILEQKNDQILKIQFCGDIIFIDKKQYSLLCESLAKMQDKCNFEIKNDNDN